MASSIERITFALPPGFDSAKHQRALASLITKQYGAGFELDSIDPGAGTATASRQAAITEVAQSAGADSFDVRLARGTKVSDGEKTEAKLMDQYEGYYMTRFEPFLGKATLTRLTDDEARCRGAVAVALGVKPWDVRVSGTHEQGYEVGLPNGYVPSKHDEKLHEVATSVIGMDGWYVKTDARNLSARIIPADPPTFPEAIPTPVKRLGKGDAMATPFGHILPEPGGEDGREAIIDWRASGSCLISGLAGGGKTVTITAILADRIANGAQLAIVDTNDKSVDFKPFKDLCAVTTMAGKTIPTWGCDSLGAAVAVLAMLCEEGKARAKYLADTGYNNWLDLPDGQRFAPIFIIADEYEALVARDPVPKALPKDHPTRLEVEQDNMAHDMIAHYMNRIVKEFRFVGLNPLISTQVSNASTGLPPSLKGKMGHFVLCGSTPSEPARRQAFPDEKSVPHVPANVASAGPVARGTGSAKIEGGGAFVFKSYFAPIGQYAQALDALGVQRHPEHVVVPTARQIDHYLPALDDDEASGSRMKGKQPHADLDRSPVSGRPASEIAAEMGDDLSWQYDEDGKKLTGFAKANAGRAASAQGAKTTPTPTESEW